MAPPVRPCLLRIKDSVSRTCVLTAFVLAFFSTRSIRLKYNFFFYLTSFRVTVPQNASTARDIHYFLCSCLGKPSTFHLPSSLIYFTLSLRKPDAFFFSISPLLSLFFSPWQYFFFSSSPYFAMTFLLGLPALCLIHSLRFTENNIAPQDFPRS